MGQLFSIVIAIAALIGYALNIIHIAQADTVTGFILVRCIGVFLAPFGAILGYF